MEKISTLIIGIGNILMGDEGVGVHVVRFIEEQFELPRGVKCLDGGTGSLTLLEPMQKAERIVLIDATIDGAKPGTMSRLRPRYSSDYPTSLTAHDIGLKDLLDSFYLIGRVPDVTLFTVSIDNVGEVNLELSGAIKAVVKDVAQKIFDEIS